MNSKVFSRLGRAAFFAPALLAITIMPAMAAKRHHSGYRYITVESRYYAGTTITAPVRPGRQGPEVRLPGGMWYRCRLNCYDTLRRESIDFWETLREEGGGRR